MTEATEPFTDATDSVDHVILIPTSRWAWNVYPSEAAASAELAALQLKEPEKFAEGTIMTLDAFVAQREASYLDAPIVEIDEERFGEALDCLPPLAYERGDGVSKFCMAEFTDGSITQQYAQMGDRYFTKPVRFRDRTTYLSSATITAALAAGAVKRAEAQS